MRGVALLCALLAGCAMNGSPRETPPDETNARPDVIVILCLFASCHYPQRKPPPAPANESRT